MERTNNSNVNRQKQMVSAKATKPVIRVILGKLPEIVNQAEKSLIKMPNNIYERNDMLVKAFAKGRKQQKGIKRERNALLIQIVEIPYLMEEFSKAATWEKYDARQQGWKQIDCPKNIAETYLARGKWEVRELSAVIHAPTLREDGSILETPGYDEKTGLLFYPGTTKFSPIPQNPTREEAIEALEVFKKIFMGFPFETPSDFSVAMSGVLTALIRNSIMTAPLHAFSAPKMGSGKSLLVDCIAIIVTGYTAAMMSQANSPEEDKKRLLALLMEGDPVICIDNIQHPIEGDALCSILTQEHWKERVLGKNKTVTVSTNATFLATGNNLEFKGDMSTRALLCVIDPKCERPEERKFDINLKKYIPENRAELVKAGLTILRAYHVAGRPKQQIAQFGRFEEWSDWVRSALVWIGLTDPCETRKRIEENDPVRNSITCLLSNWHKTIKNTVTTKELVNIAKRVGNEELLDAIVEIAGDKGDINYRKLGKYLKMIQGRIENNFYLENIGKRNNNVLWRAKSVNDECK